MIAHTTLPVSDYKKAFYAQALAWPGYENKMEYGESAGFNGGKNTDFRIEHEDTVVPSHLAFEAKSRQEERLSIRRRWLPARLTMAGRAVVPSGRVTIPRLSMIVTARISGPSGTTTKK